MTNQATQKCGYQLTNGPCGAPIAPRADSYSGYAHACGTGDGIIGWGHWASPERYGPGVKETERIFQRCAICGKLPNENQQHLLYGGHKFTVREKERSCREK